MTTLKTVDVPVTELGGVALDWVVSRLQQVPIKEDRLDSDSAHLFFLQAADNTIYSPSTNPYLAGLIIDKEKISILWRPEEEQWWATLQDPSTEESLGHFAKDRLVAAMRALITEKLGDSVSVPAALLGIEQPTKKHPPRP